MRLPSYVLVALGVAGVAAPSAARADGGSTSALSWVRLPGTESCITAPELGARVEKHLGRPVLVSPSVADVSIEGRAEAIGSGPSRRYRVVVGGTRRDRSTIGTREMVSAGTDCRALDDGLVLVVALMIDPEALSPAPAQPAPAPAPPPVVTREIVNERTVVHEIERVHDGPPPWSVSASLLGTAAIQRLSGAAPGAMAVLRAGPSKLLAFQLTLGVVPSGELTVGSRTVDFGIFEGGIAYCPAVSVARRVDVGGCAGLRAGLVHSKGRGFASDRATDRGLADVAVGPQLAVDLGGPVFGVVAANALLPLVRQQTTVTDASGKELVLDERAALGGEVALGIGVHFSP
jgi:hypothetical protein